MAILFILRDTCSDSIAKLFHACFVGYRTTITRYVAKWSIAQMCLCETSTKGGYRTILGECLPPFKRIARYGYRSDSIATSRDMGPLSLRPIQEEAQRDVHCILMASFGSGYNA